MRHDHVTLPLSSSLLTSLDEREAEVSDQPPPAPGTAAGRIAGLWAVMGNILSWLEEEEEDEDQEEEEE